MGFAGFRLARSLDAVSDEVLRASLFPEPRYWRQAEVAGGADYGRRDWPLAVVLCNPLHPGISDEGSTGSYE